MSLGSRIRQVRSLSGLSQKDVASKSGITVSFLSQVERDITLPSLKSLINIARALDIKINQLFEEEAISTKRIEIFSKNSKEKIVLEDGGSISFHFE
jgi:transcriptional regulator with XRE-family HTH domain